MSRDEGRELVRRTLSLVQGHPKLIGFANSLAAEPKKLADQLTIVSKAQGAGMDELNAFFLEGATRFDAEAFIAELRAWTRGVAATMPAPARVFFEFLAALEERDRQGEIIQINWKDVWKRIGQSGPAPSVDLVLSPLVRSALVEKRAKSDDNFSIAIHPGVAEAARVDGGAKLQEAVDEEMAIYWTQVTLGALGHYSESQKSDQNVIQAGLRSYPYLLRRKQWALGAAMLEQVLQRDRAPSTLATVLPAARKIAEMAAGTDAELSSKKTLAKALFDAGLNSDAEALMREVIEKATAGGKFGLASLVAGHLVDLVHQRQPAEALEILKNKAEYTRLAGEGDWCQLLDEAHGLQLMIELGKASEVLQRVNEMSERMEALPEIPAENDKNVVVWGVRETIFEAGTVAADHLGQYQQSIEFNTKVLQSKSERKAPILEQARTLINFYGPLLRLKQFDKARVILNNCRDIFEGENAIFELSAVFYGLADLENELGHLEEAKKFAEASLRYCYVHKTPAYLARSHVLYSDIVAQSRLREGITHRIAGMLIFTAIGSLNSSLFGTLLELLGRQSDHEPLSLDFADICKSVAGVDEVNLEGMMSSLTSDPKALLDTMLAITGQLIDQIEKGPLDE